MRILMTRAARLTMAAFLIAATVLMAAAVSLGSGVPAAVHYIGHDKVTEVMSKGGPIVSDPGLIVLAQRREAGPVEYHDHTNHVFVMVEGEATLVVEGLWLTPSEPHPIKCGPIARRRNDLPFEQRRRDYYSGEDAPLVQGSPDEDGCLLRREHRKRIG